MLPLLSLSERKKGERTNDNRSGCCNELVVIPRPLLDCVDEDPWAHCGINDEGEGHGRDTSAVVEFGSVAHLAHLDTH